MNKKMLMRNIAYEIQRNGNVFPVKRERFDAYNEKTGITDKVGKFQGVFHQSKQYQSVKVSDVTQHTTRPAPMILTTPGRLQEFGGLEKDDIIEHAGKKYRVIAVNDVENFGVAYDISLEVISDGGLQN